MLECIPNGFILFLIWFDKVISQIGKFILFSEDFEKFVTQVQWGSPRNLFWH